MRLALTLGYAGGLNEAVTLVARLERVGLDLPIPPRARIPVYVAGLGPHSVAMTAAIADGLLPLLFMSERTGAVWGAALAAGTARRSPDLAPLEICAGGIVAIGEEAAVAPIRDSVRPELALYVGGMGARGRNFYIRERIATYREAGVSVLSLSAGTPHLERLVPRLKEIIES